MWSDINLQYRQTFCASVNTSANAFDQQCLDASVGSQSDKQHLCRNACSVVHSVSVDVKADKYVDLYSEVMLWLYRGSLAAGKAN